MNSFDVLQVRVLMNLMNFHASTVSRGDKMSFVANHCNQMILNIPA